MEQVSGGECLDRRKHEGAWQRYLQPPSEHGCLGPMRDAGLATFLYSTLGEEVLRVEDRRANPR